MPITATIRGCQPRSKNPRPITSKAKLEARAVNAQGTNVNIKKSLESATFIWIGVTQAGAGPGTSSADPDPLPDCLSSRVSDLEVGDGLVTNANPSASAKNNTPD